MSKIRNIIFDLGGVLLDLDYSATQKAFQELGAEDFNAIYSQAAQNNLFDLYETGKISDAKFLEGLSAVLPAHVTETAITNAWNAMLLNLPLERLELLKRLKDHYRIFLLSNTNEIHISAFEKIILEQHKLTGLETLFEKTYYSSRIGMRKPETEIFEYVIKENNLSKSETVFFDDSIQHIRGAESAGIKAIFVEKPAVITDFFDTSLTILTP